MRPKYRLIAVVATAGVLAMASVTIANACDDSDDQDYTSASQNYQHEKSNGEDEGTQNEAAAVSDSDEAAQPAEDGNDSSQSAGENTENSGTATGTDEQAAPAEGDETEGMAQGAGTPAAADNATTTAAKTPAGAAPEVTGNEKALSNVFVTGYTWHDNTPPGSADISHGVLHEKAGGTGTYADPITVAVGHDKSSGESVLDYPQGTRFYVPDVQRYFIVEDTCGDGDSPQTGACHDLGTAPAGATSWIDVYIGGDEQTSESAATACAEKITALRNVIVNPGSGHPVTQGSLLQGNTCTAVGSAGSGNAEA